MPNATDKQKSLIKEIRRICNVCDGCENHIYDVKVPFGQQYNHECLIDKGVGFLPPEEYTVKSLPSKCPYRDKQEKEIAEMLAEEEQDRKDRLSDYKDVKPEEVCDCGNDKFQIGNCGPYDCVAICDCGNKFSVHSG